ncbi:MAG: TauD/TfdA family dioxygenase [Proteobacteria bacterium]|nr:TauD/TfdA family dioxygenase [Pseudomonadota bacterium]MDA1310811.1 TauD/TfdA family dioxygenase [Pseudomonadota bacterium]
MTSPYETIEVRPVGGALGAEIHGVDLSSDLPDRQFAEIREVFRDNGVIFFRDQKLTPEQHIAFAERWAPININRFFTPVEGHPKIALVLKEPDQKRNIGGGWHTDHTYDIEPAMGSILYAHEVPQSGGDTMFASMYAAYETLSDGLKQTLNGLRARHSSRHVFGPARAERKDDTVGRIKNPELANQDAVHPVVITHPLSGRKSLYVNPGFTLGFEGWTDAESKPLLDYLYAHASQPSFTCRFQWQAGSIAFWDNRATWHLAVNDYQGQRRLMHRITVEGTALH